MKDRFGLTYISLFLITALGALIRFNNISPFKLYPDSYQNLLVSENIRTYHNVIGYLGSNGMLYPDFFMWTRPGYALLMFLGEAQNIALLAGVMAIPLTYFFINAASRSQIAGLAGALLLTISFNHTVWSGFIMTETTGVFFMTMALWSLFSSLKNKPSTVDFLTGILFAFAVLTRYEYGIILFPVAILIFFTSTQPYHRLLYILSTFIMSILIAASQLFPIQSASVLFRQLPDLLLIGAGFGIVAIAMVVVIKKYVNNKAATHIAQLLVVILLFVLIGSGAVISFTLHDFLVSICFLLGITFMLRNPSQRILGYFVLFSIIALGAIYHRTNPDMERYVTHLLPFLIIPASYGLSKLVQVKRAKGEVILVILMLFLILAQAIFSFNGLRYLHDDSWYRTSYEEKAAGMLKQYVPQDSLVLVSLPEPYFYTLGSSTHSIADAHPFVYIPDSLGTKEIVIVQDMGMRTIFPVFTKFLETKMQDKKNTQFWVHEKFHILNKSEEEKHPVVVYKTTVRELKSRIKKTAN